MSMNWDAAVSYLSSTPRNVSERDNLYKKYCVVRHSISFGDDFSKIGMKYKWRYFPGDRKRYATLNEARAVLRNNGLISTQFVGIFYDSHWHHEDSEDYVKICGMVEKYVGRPPCYTTLEGTWVLNKNGSLGKKIHGSWKNKVR